MSHHKPSVSRLPQPLRVSCENAQNVLFIVCIILRQCHVLHEVLESLGDELPQPLGQEELANLLFTGQMAEDHGTTSEERIRVMT